MYNRIIFEERNSSASTTMRRFPCFSQRLKTSFKELRNDHAGFCLHPRMVFF